MKSRLKYTITISFFLVLFLSSFTLLHFILSIPGFSESSIEKSKPQTLEVKKMELPSYHTVFRFIVTKIPFKAEGN